MREIGTRYDFKGSNCSIERSNETLTIKADDDLKLKQVQEVLRVYLARRKVEAQAGAVPQFAGYVESAAPRTIPVFSIRRV